MKQIVRELGPLFCILVPMMVVALDLFPKPFKTPSSSLEHRMLTVLPEAKKSTLSMQQKQGWQLLSEQEVRVGTGTDIARLQYQRQSLSLEVETYLSHAEQCVADKPEMHQRLQVLARGFKSTGDDTALMEQAIDDTLRQKAAFQKENGGRLSPRQRATIYEDLQNAILSAHEQIKVVNKLGVSQGLRWQLIFKRKKS